MLLRENGLLSASTIIDEREFHRTVFGKWIRDELPKRYIINDGATILFWNDDSKTVVKRAEDDKFDPVKGFLWAYFQKTSGMSKTKANKYLRKIQDDYELKEAIKRNKLLT